MPNTTWNPSDKTAGVTLSGTNNLIATSSTSANNGVRTIDRQISGKFYFEYTFSGTGNISCGVANQGAVLTMGATTAASLAVAWVAPNGVTTVNGVQGPSIGGFSAGGIACIALDLTNQLIWFRNGSAGNWNASALANPATGVGGLAVSFVGGGIPAYGLMNTGTATGLAVTANFGDTAFTGAVPAGFTSGFPTGTPATNEILTQIAVEQWGAGTPAMQLTQIAIEEWASVERSYTTTLTPAIILSASRAGIGSVVLVQDDKSRTEMVADIGAVIQISTTVLVSTLAPGFIPSTETVYPPTLQAQIKLLPGFIASSEIVYPPALDMRLRILTPGFIPGSESVYPPTFRMNVLRPGFVAGSAIVFPPTLTLEAVLHPGFIRDEDTFFLPGLVALLEAGYSPGNYGALFAVPPGRVRC